LEACRMIEVAHEVRRTVQNNEGNGTCQRWEVQQQM
jgi:hypothetical protein